MTVRVNKDSFNLREKLSELERPIGLKGSELMRAETTQEVRDLVSAGRKNLIINGAMQVSQRGTSFTGVNQTAYHCDRYQLYYQNSSAAFTVTQSTDTPDGFGKSLKIDVTTADTSIASNEEIKLVHKIEGLNVQNIIKGTSSAVPITLSFYAKATKTGTYIVELYDRDNARDVSASYTISDTNWNRYELTYPADSGGSAFDSDNAASLEIQWWLVAGSAVQGGTLNTSWRSSTDSNSATGQVNLTDSTGNDWLITGIQLEVGKNATEFEHRSIGEELALCQRYYWETENFLWLYSLDSGHSYVRCNIFHPVEMRVAPTVTGSFSYAGSSNGYQSQTKLFTIPYVNGPGTNLVSLSAGAQFNAEL